LKFVFIFESPIGMRAIGRKTNDGDLARTSTRTAPTTRDNGSTTFAKDLESLRMRRKHRPNVLKVTGKRASTADSGCTAGEMAPRLFKNLC
jgi:hypothetical protein